MPVSGSSQARRRLHAGLPAPGVPLPRRAPPPALHPQPGSVRCGARCAADHLRSTARRACALCLLARICAAPAVTIAHGRRAIWGSRCVGGAAVRRRRCWRHGDGGDALGAASGGLRRVSEVGRIFAPTGAGWHYAAPGRQSGADGGSRAGATLALGWRTSMQAAAALARAALKQPFFPHAGAASMRPDSMAPGVSSAALSAGCGRPAGAARLSAQVLKNHSDKTFRGEVATCRCVGQSRRIARGYTWYGRASGRIGAGAAGARQCGRIAGGAGLSAGNAECDGHWNQNQWLGGKPYWGGIQLDETAFPVLLAASLAERDALGDMVVAASMRRALAFLVQAGPASPQDRWEEDAGVNPFTLAVCIAALVAGAGLLPDAERGLPLAVADFWNARLEDWCVARGTALGARHGVPAYYVREAPPDILGNDYAMQRVLSIKNQSDDLRLAADAQIATDFLQLVRLGLRRADDALIVDTLALADALLKTGRRRPVWHRYNGDGYGRTLRRPRILRADAARWPSSAATRPLRAPAAAKRCVLVAMKPRQPWPDPRTGMGTRHSADSGRGGLPAAPCRWRGRTPEFVKLAASRIQGYPFVRPASCGGATAASGPGRRPPSGPPAPRSPGGARPALWMCCRSGGVGCGWTTTTTPADQATVLRLGTCTAMAGRGPAGRAQPPAIHLAGSV